MLLKIHVQGSLDAVDIPISLQVFTNVVVYAIPTLRRNLMENQGKLEIGAEYFLPRLGQRLMGIPQVVGPIGWMILILTEKNNEMQMRPILNSECLRDQIMLMTKYYKS